MTAYVAALGTGVFTVTGYVSFVSYATPDYIIFLTFF